jgi:hypothetical protein
MEEEEQGCQKKTDKDTNIEFLQRRNLYFLSSQFTFYSSSTNQHLKTTFIDSNYF